MPMAAAFQFAGLAMVVLVSITFALLLEWLSLWGIDEIDARDALCVACGGNI
jgi:hypothetical protein